MTKWIIVFYITGMAVGFNWGNHACADELEYAPPKETVILTPMIPNTTLEDWNAPKTVLKPDGTVYQTLPGSTLRDFDKPIYKLKRKHENGN